MSRLQNLYTQLMREPWLRSWHDNYKAFYEEVEDIRDRINKGESSFPDTDRAFLRKLLYEKKNGVASRGQSILSDNNFKLFIEKKEFISSLQKLILEPNKQNWKDFGTVWSDQKKGNRPLLVNRVAAACTLKVSTTVDVTRFYQVFKWLMDEKIIEPTEEELKKMPDWFSINQFLMEFMHREFSGELEKNKNDPANNKIDKFYLSMFVWRLYENVSERPFSLKKQIVKYGPPGTGKTYQAREQASILFDNWKTKFDPDKKFREFDNDKQYELVQFHPSFSYEDFIEGLRPVLEDEKVQLKLQNGIFKEFCIKAARWEIDIYKLDKELDWESLTIEELIKHKSELKSLSKDQGHWEYIFDRKAQLESEFLASKVMDVVPPFFFIIDEINRAELSRVFGELMYCFEYRGVDGKIKTQYANLNNENTGMLEIDENEQTGMPKTDKDYRFFIPTNIYLIGTMNTIDRSVESFDLALRRRFLWQEVPPDIELLRYHLMEKNEAWADLAGNLWKLNEAIAGEHLLGPDYQIGHAYLMNMNYAKDIEVKVVREYIWEDSILPLLQEYLRGSGEENNLIGHPNSTLREAFFKK